MIVPSIRDRFGLTVGRLDSIFDIGWVWSVGKPILGRLEGGNMLSAITANLPVYHAPPRPTGEDQRPRESADFGPAAEVDVEALRAAGSEQSRRTGLYGPDGQFVEAGAQGESRSRPQRSPADEPSTSENTPDERMRSEAADPTARERRLEAVKTESASRRDLTLAEVDAAVPPAARAELRELADRLSRHSENSRLQADDYRQLAKLMERVGRYEDARVAEAKAGELESGREQETPQTVSADPAAA